MHDIWNPWHGCKKCSPGCQNCYMYFLDERRGVSYKSDDVFKTRNFKYPLSRSRDGSYKVKSGEHIRVNMTSDTFVEDADPWREEMWDIVRKRKDVVFWFLTKRPERILSCLPSDWGDGWENVSMNVTCENQEMFDKRIDYLLNLPAKHKGLCLAPLISDIDITKAAASPDVEFIGTGGENYYSPRPCDYAWVKHIADTCRQYRKNFYWYETGTNFWMDGRQYWMPNKQRQSIEAYFAGLNQEYYDVIFHLYDENGNELDDHSLHKRMYNLDHCLFCSNQDRCNGCSSCGNCGCHERIVTRRHFKDVQEAAMRCVRDHTSDGKNASEGYLDMLSYYGCVPISGNRV